jgi:hypothetical protein
VKDLVAQDLEALFQLSLSTKDTQEEDIFLGRKRDKYDKYESILHFSFHYARIFSVP